MSDLTEAVREALAKATGGRWYWRNTSLDVYLQGAGTRIVMGFKRRGMNGAQPEFLNPTTHLLDPVGGRNINEYPDARLIASAPVWLADLCDRLDAAEAAIERVRALHQPIHGDACSECDDMLYPCPTIRALDPTP